MFARSLLLAFLMSVGPVLAQESPSPSEGARLVEQSFQRATEAVLEHQDRVRANPGQAYRLIESVLAPLIDFDLMARLVLGSHWAAASPSQRLRFSAAFRESLMRTYAFVLADNVDEIARRLREEEPVLRVQPVRAGKEQKQIVVRTVLQLEEAPIPIDYRLHARGGRWRVYDVIILNVSFVTNLRVEYDALLRRQGLDAVIEELRQRNLARAAEGEAG